MAGASDYQSSVLYSSTWAIAVTCFVFVAISIFFEKVIEWVGHLIVKYRQIALQAAFKRIIDELLVVGFISIALTVGTSSAAKICVPQSAAAAMPLCRPNSTQTTVHVGRMLAAAAPQNCSEGNVPFMPYEGFHQLHIFIFVLAVVHIVYSLLVVGLGMWVVRYWKNWEAKSLLYNEDSTHEVRLAKETTFVRTRLPIPSSWMQLPFVVYLVAFFRQFFRPISEADYTTLRNGFILSHTPGHLNFNFHKYIRRSLQDDLQHVVGISPLLWLFACIWLLINVQGWETQLWTAFIAFALLLVLGTKLQVIITRMALRYKSSNIVAMGVPNVKPSDDLFWFHRPYFTLKCIHFVIFQNALDVSFVLWIALSFSTNNCIYHRKHLLIVRMIIGLITQALCGIVTMPSYALVSQMGTNIKRTMFEKDIQVAIGRWYQHARDRVHEHDSSKGDHDDHGTDSEPQSPTHVEMAHV